jgi:hypothetical protein
MLNTMQPGDFCLWLKSMLDTREAGSMTSKETAPIRENLWNVFRHEIDPLMGDGAHQALLNKLHSGLSR